MAFGEQSPGGGQLARAHVRHSAHAGGVDEHRDLVGPGLHDVQPVVAVQVAERDGLGARADLLARVTIRPKSK